MTNWGRLYFGSLVVAVGVILLLDNTGVLDAGRIFSDWWPIAIILAGVLAIVSNRRHWHVPVILVAVGVAFLLSNLNIVDVGALIFPVVIILVGLFILFGWSRRARDDHSDRINSFNVFSGSDLRSLSQNFQGGSLSAVFGGADIDLRDANLASEARLDVFLAFGGIDLKVPKGWHVSVRGLPIFGGVDNKTAKQSLGPDAPVLQVYATILFGGMDIHN